MRKFDFYYSSTSTTPSNYLSLIPPDVCMFVQLKSKKHTQQQQQLDRNKFDCECERANKS